MGPSRPGGIVGAPFNVLGPPHHHHHPPFIPVHPPIPIMPPPRPETINITVNSNSEGGGAGQAAIDQQQNTEIAVLRTTVENLSGTYYSIVSGNYDNVMIAELFDRLSGIAADLITLSNNYSDLLDRVDELETINQQYVTNLIPPPGETDDYSALIENLNNFGNDIDAVVNRIKMNK